MAFLFNYNFSFFFFGLSGFSCKRDDRIFRSITFAGLYIRLHLLQLFNMETNRGEKKGEIGVMRGRHWDREINYRNSGGTILKLKFDSSSKNAQQKSA